MPRRLGIAVVLLALGVVIGATLRPNLAADPPKEEKKEKPIPIMDVWTRGILGQLGHPLGTVVRIEGEVEAYDGLKHGKALEGKTLLRVKLVNGTEPKEGVLFGLDFAKADKPKVGEKFKYIGYETGTFEGHVARNELYKDPIPFAWHDYGFVTTFDIIKDELKPEKK